MSKLHAIQRDAVRGSELIAKLDRAYNLASHNEHLREFAADELSNDPGGAFYHERSFCNGRILPLSALLSRIFHKVISVIN